MGKFVPPQLSALLGSDLDAVDEAALQRLVGVVESDVLEFKSDHYGTDGEAKRELAFDVAGFANAAGGLLVVGMDEDNDTGAATSIVPLSVQPHGVEEDTRYRQILAGQVVPRLDVDIECVDVSGGNVLLVGVPPSPRRPHAVERNGSLRYPVRDGRQRGWLHEWEIADAYRQRFDAAEAGVARADAAFGRVRQFVDTAMAGSDDPESAWLVMALAPDRAGELRLDHDTVTATREWSADIITAPIDFLIGTLEPSSGFRSIELADQRSENRQRARLFAVLGSDGTGAAAIRVDHGRIEREPKGRPLAVLDVHLFLAALGVVELLAGHAIGRCGTGGTATALVHLDVRGGTVVLGHVRRQVLRQLPNARPSSSTPIGRRTVALDDVWPASPGLVSACAVLLSDVTGPLGVPTPLQADRGGRIRRPYIEREILGDLQRWADDHSIDVIDDTVDG